APKKVARERREASVFLLPPLGRGGGLRPQSQGLLASEARRGSSHHHPVHQQLIATSGRILLLPSPPQILAPSPFVLRLID
uniref:Uncharacterized protein n=1 Tax=Aegilops tauschii subsp. strangulata TaxID=200361 RepID=A0A453HG05_AEGTS